MDRWDFIGGSGLALILIGVGMIYTPAAFITAGVFTLGTYVLREYVHVPESRDSEGDAGDPPSRID